MNHVGAIMLGGKVEQIDSVIKRGGILKNFSIKEELGEEPIAAYVLEITGQGAVTSLYLKDTPVNQGEGLTGNMHSIIGYARLELDGKSIAIGDNGEKPYNTYDDSLTMDLNREYADLKMENGVVVSGKKITNEPLVFSESMKLWVNIRAGKGEFYFHWQHSGVYDTGIAVCRHVEVGLNYILY